MSKTDRQTLKDDLAKVAADLSELVDRLGGVDRAAQIAEMRPGRLAEAVAGDLSRINPLHISRMEAEAGESLVHKPAGERLTRRVRDAMSTPTERDLSIAASAALLAAAKANHAAVSLPDRPSMNEVRELTKANAEAQRAMSKLEDMRAVTAERARPAQEGSEQ